MTPVRWAWVPDYEGLYRISSRGDIWSEPRATTRGGILKHIVHPNGYHFVTLTRDGIQQRFPVHGLVMRAFVGSYPEGMEVRHLDGDPGNNCWAPGNEEETRAAGGNLVYGTHSRNMQDKKEHGTEWQSNVTHCPKNHKYTPENTRILKSGSRACRECATIQSREWMRAHATRTDTAMTCPHCRQEFERPLGQGRRKFCSDECKKAARRVQRKAA
jgi:HNH endonuclease/NUMOD4 motif